MKVSPLRIARNAAEKCRELFSKDNHPGWALFAKIGRDHVEQANTDIKAAKAELEEVMADGVITPEEQPRAQHAMQLLAGVSF